MMERTAELLSILQSFPMEDKIQMTQDRIVEFIEKVEEQGHGAYVSALSKMEEEEEE